MLLTIDLTELHDAASSAYVDGAYTDGKVQSEADPHLDNALQAVIRLTGEGRPLTPDEEVQLLESLGILAENDLHIQAELRPIFASAHEALARIVQDEQASQGSRLQRRAEQIAGVPFAERDEAYWGGYVHSPISESLEEYLTAAFLAGQGVKGCRGTPLGTAYEVLKGTNFGAMEVIGRFANPQAVRLMVQWRAELCHARELLEKMFLRGVVLTPDEKVKLGDTLAIAPYAFDLSGDGRTAEVMKGVLTALAKSDSAGRSTGFVLVYPDGRPAGKAPDSDVDAEAERQGFTRSPGSASFEEYLDAAVPPRSGGGGADNEAEDTPGEEVWDYAADRGSQIADRGEGMENAEPAEAEGTESSGLLPETGGLAGAGSALGVGSGLLGAGSAAFAGTPAISPAIGVLTRR